MSLLIYKGRMWEEILGFQEEVVFNMNKIKTLSQGSFQNVVDLDT